jgi:hypothetical protein
MRLLRLEEPHEVNDAWKKWTNDVLVPPSGRYGYRPDEGGGKARRLDEIKAALATADRVIIATDCDREGQAIGESLVRHFGFKGMVLRALFTAEDPKSLAAAFAAASPNETYRPLYDAAVARQQADQIFNLTLTRVASGSPCGHHRPVIRSDTTARRDGGPGQPNHQADQGAGKSPDPRPSDATVKDHEPGRPVRATS